MKPEDLPDAEFDVLSVLWKLREATTREIRDALEERRPMTHGAMCMLVKRLQDKALIKRRPAERGRSFLYQPAVRPEGTQRNLLSRLRERMFSGDSVALVQSLFETQPPTDNEVEQLEALLDELKGNRATKREPRR